jgi:site-specific recombinase XerD
MRSSESPFLDYWEDWEQSLHGRGYRPRTVEHYLAKCRTFESFLAQRGIGLGSLDESCVQGFLVEKLAQRQHRDEGAARGSWNRPLDLLLEYLRSRRAVPDSAVPGPVDHPLLLEYATFLRAHRAVAERTVEDQSRHLRRLLEYLGAGPVDDLIARFSIERIDDFFVEMSRRVGRETINSACSAVRGFLRYLHMRGRLQADLAEQVARPRFYSLSSLPRAIDWRAVERTLARVDRTTLVGTRDYAVLVLLAYCGLRAGEVAGLRLDDIDWSHDTIRLSRPKPKVVDHLPLVPLVGEALIEYLRRRPASPFRHVFLKVLAPAGPLSSPSVTWIARKYLLGAGVEVSHLGAHTFRHSYAVRLLRQGFPLKTIGDALGHRHPQSTFIYTKAAVEDLRCVSLDIKEVLP